jgi:hypothetical protein
MADTAPMEVRPASSPAQPLLALIAPCRVLGAPTARWLGCPRACLLGVQPACLCLSACVRQGHRRTHATLHPPRPCRLPLTAAVGTCPTG